MESWASAEVESVTHNAGVNLELNDGAQIFAAINDAYGLVDLRAGSVARVAEELERERLRIIIHLGDFQGERRRVFDLAGTLSLRHGGNFFWSEFASGKLALLTNCTMLKAEHSLKTL
jgi:hypothetical protein